MYEHHFGLSRQPFPCPLDAAAYPATGYESALAALHEGLADGESVLTLTGPPGVGKSLLARSLALRLGDAAVYLNTAIADPGGLLQALLFDLSLPHAGLLDREMRLAVVEHLLTRYQGGRRTVILIDEAHQLNAATLEELRLLCNLEGAVQVMLIGQPGLNLTLEGPSLDALRQRIAVRVVLEPLGVEEAADYVLHHLRVAGGADSLVGPEALELLARATGGVARRMDQAMHRALRLTAAAGADEIELEAMMEALTGLGLSADEADEADEYRLFAPAHPA